MFASADYPRAHEAFLQAAVYAHQAGDESKAAFDWTNAGSCSILTIQLGRALRELDYARQIAGAAHQLRPLIFTLNALASLYIHMGQFENAIMVARPGYYAKSQVRSPSSSALMKPYLTISRV